MTNATIRLGDLHQLTGLLPENTPPRAVSAVARWAVEMNPTVDNLTLGVGREAHDSRFAEFLVDYSERTAGEAEDVSAEAPVADEGASAPLPVPEDVAEGGNDAAEEPPAPVATPTVAIDNLQAPPWSEEDSSRLLAGRIAGRTFAQIGEELGRTQKACEVRFRKLRANEPKAVVAPVTPPTAPKTRVTAAAVKVDAGVPPAADPGRSRIAQLVAAMAALDDSFEPADDMLLVDQRYVGTGFPVIAVELGCDEDTVKARWRAILKCGVANTGGIVTATGWDDLRAAVARRAAEAEA